MIPENRKIPAEQLSIDTAVNTLIDTRVHPANPDQIINTGDGFATIASVYRRPDNSVIDFRTSGKLGATILPVYDEFSFNVVAITESNADEGKGWVLIGSFDANPNILIPNKPTSPLDVYADQATMTADFASQVSGSHYAYTGSTSMWLYDGTATDSIANYTEVVEISGWSESGTKPSFLNVTGTILTGYANLNRLVFELVMIDGVPKVNLVITQWTGANADPNAPSFDPLGAILWLPMTEFGVGDVIDDLSGNNYDATIIEPATAFVEVADPTYNPVISLASVDPRSRLTVANNIDFQNLTNFATIMMLIKTTDGSSRTFFRLYDGTVGIRMDSSSAVGTARFQAKINSGVAPEYLQVNTPNSTLLNGQWTWVVVTLDDHESNELLMRGRIYLQDGEDNFVSSGTITGTKANIGNLNTLYIGSNELGTTRDNTLWGFFGMWDRVLTPVEMSTVIANSDRLII